ncbi:hypothetical protein GGR55DRAFT_647481 [Xylaria sp. FL0064]|nr:hypothetical protein GGR55DRAFT_647481 [Xylaria sp. FL0064]
MLTTYIRGARMITPCKPRVACCVASSLSVVRTYQGYVHCTVLNLRPLRQITRIPKDKEYKIAEPNGTLTIKIKMSISQSLRDRGIKEATDIFKFIITTRPIRVAGLTLPDPETVVRITRGTDDTRGRDESNLEGLLQGKAVYENPPDDLVVRETVAPRWTCYSVLIWLILLADDYEAETWESGLIVLFYFLIYSSLPLSLPFFLSARALCYKKPETLCSVLTVDP